MLPSTIVNIFRRRPLADPPSGSIGAFEVLPLEVAYLVFEWIPLEQLGNLGLTSERMRILLSNWTLSPNCLRRASETSASLCSFSILCKRVTSLLNTRERIKFMISRFHKSLMLRSCEMKDIIPPLPPRQINHDHLVDYFIHFGLMLAKFIGGWDESEYNSLFQALDKMFFISSRLDKYMTYIASSATSYARNIFRRDGCVKKDLQNTEKQLRLITRSLWWDMSDSEYTFPFRLGIIIYLMFGPTLSHWPEEETPSQVDGNNNDPTFYKRMLRNDLFTNINWDFMINHTPTDFQEGKKVFNRIAQCVCHLSQSSRLWRKTSLIQVLDILFQFPGEWMRDNISGFLLFCNEKITHGKGIGSVIDRILSYINHSLRSEFFDCIWDLLLKEIEESVENIPIDEVIIGFGRFISKRSIYGLSKRKLDFSEDNDPKSKKEIHPCKRIKSSPVSLHVNKEGEMENMWDWVSSFWNKATPLDESYILPPGELESIDGKGKITQMGPEYGLIDGKFSMDLSDIGMNSLKVGDIVNYSASRPAPNREWVISSVSSIDNRRVRTGIRLYNGKAKIHDEQLLVSVISHSSLNSFKPDDLISVEFGPEDEIINIEPLRSRSKRVGVVTAYNQDLMKGKIDEQVYFSGEVTLIKGYSLFQVGDYVEYEAIERKGILPWRATQMVLTLPQTHKSIKKSKGPNNSHTKELFKSKKGVSLSGESFDFGDVHFEETSSKSIDIQNNSLRDISVTKVTISGRIGSAQFSTDFKAPQTICKSTLLSLNINCSAVNIGKIKVLIIVELEDKNEIFTLGAHLLSNVLPPSQSLNESIKKCQLKSFKSLSVLPGRRLQRKDCGLNKSWFYKLKSYPIPETLKIEPIKVRKYLKKGTPKFRILRIWKKTALTGIRMHLVGEYLEMNIGEDLSLFPSLYEGDEVKVSPDNDEYDYQGFIHCIKGSIVYIQFDPSFHKSYSGAPCSVKFIKSRTPYRIMHRSVEIAEEYLGPEILFPSEIRLRKPLIHVSEDVKIFKREPTPILNKKQQIYPKKISVADKLGSSFKSLESDNFVVPIYSLNLQQRLSIKGKAKSPSKLPHHFSPNTKSKEKNGEKKVPAYVPNVVPFKKGNSCIEWTQPYLNPEQKQAVRSILKGEARPIPYIIFGPPGTGKTVTLLETILQIFILRKDSRILVTAPSNAACDLLLNLLAASKKVKPGDVVRILGARRKFENIPEYLIPYYFSIKNEKETMEGVLKSRIVVTTCTSSSFFSRIKDFRRFTHVFVDEAGFVLEPDILTPLNFVDIEEGQIVLAGDEKQLCSFNPLYAPDPNKFVTRFSDSYDSLLITKLVRNYRNHPAILKLPSKLFYHDELIPSYFTLLTENNGETRIPLREDQVGIITPYRKQVDCIKSYIQSFDLPIPKVGSVEEFQGQERLIILLSTVRSSTLDTPASTKHVLGFVGDEKRFNVALTRAKDLLIIVGNPKVLIQDSVWKEFIEYCDRNHVIDGCEFTFKKNKNHEYSCWQTIRM
ncbi:unnamed protein product [Lepeophtheirus salmonis]|uniref:RNA helicase n=1 Tax=Lepeophtheirus salmonis TaxID=72036 RepID=A0A7R8H700_LEPSM|nr:unnamed protein product [Lepeophtheirus salmonis]CAF2898775.1 unnamed protein product [Lepeophtheirus salmonis]